MKYVFNVNEKNFIIGYKLDENGIEVAEEDVMYLPCCQFIDGKIVLNEERKSKYISHLRKENLAREKKTLETWLSSHDYIGTKIATGRATAGDYATEIAEMTAKANRINEIDELLRN